MTNKEIMALSDRQFLKYLATRWLRRSAVRKRLNLLAEDGAEKVVSLELKGTVS